MATPHPKLPAGQSPRPATSYQHVDVAHLDQMIDGSSVLLADLIGMYTKQIPLVVEQLTVLINRGDHAQLARVAHKAKGAASMLGIMGLAMEMKRLEELARLGKETAEYSGYIERYREISLKGLKELSDILNGMQLK